MKGEATTTTRGKKRRRRRVLLLFLLLHLTPESDPIFSPPSSPPSTPLGTKRTGPPPQINTAAASHSGIRRRGGILLRLWAVFSSSTRQIRPHPSLSFSITPRRYLLSSLFRGGRRGKKTHKQGSPGGLRRRGRSSQELEGARDARDEGGRG